MNYPDGQISLFGQDSLSGKTSETLSAAIPQALCPERTSGSSWRRSSELRYITLMSLDLTPDAGDLLGESYWEDTSPWHGGSLMLNTGPAPRSEDAGCLLSQILLEDVPQKYYLSRKACRGILSRSKRRGKPLPPQLELALKLQAGVIRPPPGVPMSELMQTAMNEQGAAALQIAFAANQRDEVRDLIVNIFNRVARKHATFCQFPFI